MVISPMLVVMWTPSSAGSESDLDLLRSFLKKLMVLGGLIELERGL